jgi:hypothetical protein
MAWPPPDQPTNATDQTEQVTVHPDLHNNANGAINDTRDELIAQEGRYSASGTITVPSPRFVADGTISRMNAAGVLYSYLDGIRDPQNVYNSSPGSVVPNSSNARATAQTSVDTSNSKTGFYMQGQASSELLIPPGQWISILVGIRERTAGVWGSWTAAPQTFRQKVYISNGQTWSSQLTVTTLVVPFFIQGDTDTVEMAAMFSSGAGGSVDLLTTSVTSLPFFR